MTAVHEISGRQAIPVPTAEAKNVSERERNLRVAEALRREHRWSGQTFNDGNCVALLDGKIIAVADNPDDAIAALRAAEPDPRRGMVIEVNPPKVDAIRRGDYVAQAQDAFSKRELSNPSPNHIAFEHVVVLG
jgi:hypothetical protein